MVERIEPPSRDPFCDILSDQGWSIYGWRSVVLLDGGWFIRRAENEGRNSYGCGTSSTVSLPFVCCYIEQVEKFCSCTRHSNCFTVVLFDRVCECQYLGRHCIGCYFGVGVKNNGWMMISPTTSKVLMGHFLRGVEPSVVSQKSCLLPIRVPASLS